MFELTLGNFLIAEAETEKGIYLARKTLGNEMRIRSAKLTIHYPENFMFPIAGGGEMSARDLGLPLSEN